MTVYVKTGVHIYNTLSNIQLIVKFKTCIDEWMSY